MDTEVILLSNMRRINYAFVRNIYPFEIILAYETFQINYCSFFQ